MCVCVCESVSNLPGYLISSLAAIRTHSILNFSLLQHIGLIPLDNCTNPPVVCEPCDVSGSWELLFSILCDLILNSTLPPNYLPLDVLTQKVVSFRITRSVRKVTGLGVLCKLWAKEELADCWLVWFYGISTIVGYLLSGHVNTHIDVWFVNEQFVVSWWLFLLHIRPPEATLRPEVREWS